jgi:non-ribosomal peptide synthetase component F
MTAFAAVQARYAGATRAVVGTVDSGRQMDDSDRAMGPFMRTFPVPAEFLPGADFLSVLSDVSTFVSDAMDHWAYGYDDLVADLGLRRTRGANPLFQTMFAWQNVLEGQAAVEGMAGTGVVQVPFHGGTAKFELLLEGRLSPGGSADFEIEYRTAVYRPESVARLAGDLFEFVRQAVASPRIRLESIMLRAKDARGPARIGNGAIGEAAFDFGDGGGR